MDKMPMMAPIAITQAKTINAISAACHLSDENRPAVATAGAKGLRLCNLKDRANQRCAKRIFGYYWNMLKPELLSNTSNTFIITKKDYLGVRQYSTP